MRETNHRPTATREKYVAQCKCVPPLNSVFARGHAHRCKHMCDLYYSPLYILSRSRVSSRVWP